MPEAPNRQHPAREPDRSFKPDDLIIRNHEQNEAHISCHIPFYNGTKTEEIQASCKEEGSSISSGG